MKLFGTDGIRGVANGDLTPELAFRLGRVFGYMIAQPDHPRFVIGVDTRRSCQLLESALSAGLASQGVDVSLAGTIPTPGLAFLTRACGFTGGVMISASHNPAEYNGIKFISSDGFKLTNEEEGRIEKLIETYDFISFPEFTGPRVGTITHDPALAAKYLTYLRTIDPIPLNGLRLVLDLANGSTHALAPALFASRGATVIPIANKPDGTNINLSCGSTHLDNLKTAMAEHRGDAGLAFDGDGDRVLAVDEKGNAVDGDQILFIAACEQALRGQLQGNLVVATTVSNYGLEETLRENRITLKRTAVGDRHVVEEMRRTGATLGGEQSGHIIFLTENTTGDGLITGAKLLAAMRRTGLPLSALAARMKRYPQTQINVHVPQPSSLGQNAAAQAAITAAQRELDGEGRVLVRASGTEPLVRILAEGRDPARVRLIAEDLAGKIENELALREGFNSTRPPLKT